MKSKNPSAKNPSRKNPNRKNTRTNLKRGLTTLFLLLLLLAVLIAGLSIGFIPVPLGEVLQTLLGEGTPKLNFLLFELRLPKILITLLLGLALALSGSVLQTLTKNDLADPGILGINAGAGLGVTLAYLYLGVEGKSIVYLLPLMSGLSALLTFALTYGISLDKNKTLDVDKFILVGVGSSISLSGAMILFISSADRGDVRFIYRWLSGNIWGSTRPFVYATALPVFLLSLFIFLKHRTLDILSFDDITATGLGVNRHKEKTVLLIVAVLLAAVTVSVAGSIAFVGLIMPHAAKKIYGTKHKNFLPGALLLGALFLMIATLLGSNILPPDGLPAGITVALIGAPYFLWLIVRKTS